MHISVLKDESLNEFGYLSNSDGYFVDGTLGLAGHSLALINKYPNANFKIIGIDKDVEALQLSKKRVAELGLSDRFIFVHNDFSEIKTVLAEAKIERIMGALLDLGVSSLQLDKIQRGFTFNDPDAILDMRMDQTQEKDARYVLNNYPSAQLEKIFIDYGEERFAGTIAKNIAKKRVEKHFETVGELLETLQLSIPKKIIATSKKHYATNVFRALRMEVNEEVSKLKKTIGNFVDVLQPNGKLAIITFHSIEDRIVKNAFRELENPCICPPEIPYCACGRKPSIKIVHKKPLIPSDVEIAANPRARSAKLRVAEKL